MKKTEHILGIIAVSLFSVSLFFKFMHWPGASIMLAISVLLFNFGYLPLQLIRERRVVTGSLEISYLIFRFIALFIILTGILFKIQHWPGAGLLLRMGSFAIPLFLLFYFYVRIKGKGKLAFNWSDLIITILAYTIYLFITQSIVSPVVMEGYVMLEGQYEKANTGLESANSLIYARLDSISRENNQELFESVQKLKENQTNIYNCLDSLKQGFIATFYYEPLGNEFNIQTYSRPGLAETEWGNEFFLEQGHAIDVKRAVEQYLIEIDKIRQKHNLITPFAANDPDLIDYMTPWGERVTWEIRMFKQMPVAAILTNLSRIKHTALLAESVFLAGLLGQLNLSGDARLLQELAIMESEKAMAVKENELVRIRQQQELQNAVLLKSEAELKNSKTITVAAFVGIAFVLILFSISTRAFILKQKDNKSLASQNKEIVQQKEEIEAQRDEIEAQRDLVFNQKEQIQRTHNEISASIDYAMRLQNSILPGEELLKEFFNGHFVFFKPKQKVSGDFYWWTRVDNQVIIAVTDCTGHGVPGAFMSLLGVSLLQEIVDKSQITQPAEILNKLREEVIRSLHQTGSQEEQKDGMDLALISIDTDTLVCNYAGANNSLYVIRDSRLTHHKPDMMPISFYERMDPFASHEIQLKAGDQLYMFSDGYADQFGGEKRKKFKYAAFQKLLSKNSQKEMSEQHRMLTETISKWQGDQEQIDDMVVVGIRV